METPLSDMPLFCGGGWIASCPGTALKMHAFHPQKATMRSCITNIPYWLMVEAPQGQVLALEPEPTAQHHSPLHGTPLCVSRALFEVWTVCHLISCALTRSEQPCSERRSPLWQHYPEGWAGKSTQLWVRSWEGLLFTLEMHNLCFMPSRQNDSIC